MNPFFVVSKLLAFIEQPLNWVLCLLLLSVVFSLFRRPRAAKRMQAAGLVLLIFIGVLAVPNSILRALENAVPPTRQPIDSSEGIVVLGGAMHTGRVPLERGQILIDDAAERLTETLTLARRYAAFKIVFTGYSSALLPEGISEAEAAAKFFEQQGLPASRLILEGRSRNTHENAIYSKQLSGVDATRRWLLLTSASHMPRALAVFRKAGWNIEPLPVDYQTGTSIDYFHYSLAAGADRWNIVLHELLGLAAYRITGRI